MWHSHSKLPTIEMKQLFAPTHLVDRLFNDCNLHRNAKLRYTNETEQSLDNLFTSQSLTAIVHLSCNN